MKTQSKLSCVVLVIYGLFSGFNGAYAEGGGHGSGGGHGGGGHRDGGGGHGKGGHGGGGHGGDYHGYSSFGFYFGAPVYPYPYYRYGYPYSYYPPAIVTVPSRPPVYIQQAPSVTQQNPPGYWYYCANPQGYHPYIKDCPSGWQQVEPVPPPSH